MMQCNCLPPAICKNLDKLNRDFLWGSTDEKKKKTRSELEYNYHFKTTGGILISKEIKFSILANFSWRSQKPATPWADILRYRYSRTNGRAIAMGSITWKSLNIGKTTLEEKNMG